MFNLTISSHESRIFVKAKIKNGSISHAQLIESLPDDDAKAIGIVAEDILKASSYLLNMYCKTSGVSNKDCVKFMSKYSLPEASRLSTRCVAMSSYSRAYRRLLPASYRDGLEKVNLKNSQARRSASHFFYVHRFDLPLPAESFHSPELFQIFFLQLVWRILIEEMKTR